MKLYRHRITLDIITKDKKPKLHDVALVQSPGPVPYLFDVDGSDDLDPFVEDMKLVKSEELSKEEVHELLPVDETDPVGRPNKAGKHNK